MLEIFILLFLFQVKHFISDFILQTEYMLGKFKTEGWILPLTCHCLVHVGFTLVIALMFNPSVALSVSVIDFVIHFTMDRIKASPKMLGKYDAINKKEFIQYANRLSDCKKDKCLHWEIPRLENSMLSRKKENTMFWRALGIDQGVHHLTHYFIIYMIVR